MAKTNKPTVEEIIQKAVFATRLAAERQTKDAFKATESRLYDYPILKLRINDKIEELNEIRNNGIHKKSKSIVRFQKNGVRLSEEEIMEAVIKDLEAQIAGDRKECETIEKAISILDGDQYQNIIGLKYFDGLSDFIGVYKKLQYTEHFKNMQKIIFETAKNKMAALSFISVKFIPREIAGSGFHIRFYGVFQAIIPFDI